MAALVTGAGKRLGRAMALYLAGRGHDVAVHYASSAEEAAAVVAEIEALGRRAVAVQADLLDEAQVETVVTRAAAALGPLTVLVNNASIFEYDTVQSGTRTSWDRAIESNLRAPLVLMQGFAAQCPQAVPDENGEPVAQGLVVNMIDQRVLKLTPEFASYTIAKMGLWALTRTAAQGLAPHVRVNGIGPGPTLQGARQSDQHFARQRAATILGRGAHPSDVTAALGFFLDSPGVTGQMIAVDGGQHLGWKTPDVLGVE
ncbi:SDR family oxidoreductase [Pseudotabrizicola sp. 4114]|uniref:SDR family oxidoreductase n=1 Tax=Pseudotabrizicola sp. 4114 TaxID=2817731 RepID=UPI002854DB4C|nr:NAD(P)-dependent dehydrogenase (short-subunit alcohol dehydrogenase family) [Pseudorhodobacter sp. 4114]